MNKIDDTKKKRRSFVIPKRNMFDEKDPETIFRDIVKSQSQPKEVKNLWAQQADILRDYYENAKDKEDVALELPTGTGKTLIGLLIGEYRRRVKGEKIVYLCPTRQLAYQVYNKAQEYGISSCILVGKQVEYPKSDYGDYLTSKTIAITTYSAIFNTNPKLDDAQVIIMDDIHSAETYISSLWTVKIQKDESIEVFEEILDMFKNDIPEYLYHKLLSGESIVKIYDVVPYPRYYEKISELRHYLDERVEECGNDAKYPWEKISGHLEACHLYISKNEINIKPIIPPTLTHKAFSGSNQRIYMSATLGEEGQLERLTGVKNIKRLTIPKGWDKYNPGRRLILFPDRKFDLNQTFNISFKAIEKQGRVLVICPNYHNKKEFKNRFSQNYPHVPILEANDIEESLDCFTDNDKAVLLLTRYDGLDLSGEKCRLIIIFGLPEATNLQEGFLWNRLNAHTFLNERVLTRMTQALGRCTRSDDDFTNVLMFGTDLLKFCALRENIKHFHPEIQAEIEFGIANSETFEDEDDILGFMDDFIHDEEFFADINKAIGNLRDSSEKTAPKTSEKLQKSFKDEIFFSEAIWKSELDFALEKAKSITDTLSGGKELNGYRTWWFYLAGSCSYLAYKKYSKDLSLAKNYFSSAFRISKTLTWLADLIYYVPVEDNTTKSDYRLTTQIESIENVITDLKVVGPKFEKEMNIFMEYINQDKFDSFEKGVKILGSYLGFKAIRPVGDGVPDGVWILRDYIWGFEVKSEEKPDNSISLSSCREANGHKNWIIENIEEYSENTKVYITMISYKEALHPAAYPQSHDLHHQNVENIRCLALETVKMLRNIRSLMLTTQEEQSIKENILENLVTRNLSYENIHSFLVKYKLDEFKQKKF